MKAIKQLFLMYGIIASLLLHATESEQKQLQPRQQEFFEEFRLVQGYSDSLLSMET